MNLLLLGRERYSKILGNLEDWDPGGASVVPSKTGRVGMISQGFPQHVSSDQQVVLISASRQWVCAVATQT